MTNIYFDYERAPRNMVIIKVNELSKMNPQNPHTTGVIINIVHILLSKL